MSLSIRKVKTTDLELKDRLVAIKRVTKVTKGGRTFSFSAIVVVGNEDGIVGYGLGKANEVTTAIAKGVEDAKKNLIKVPILRGTIPIKHIEDAIHIAIATVNSIDVLVSWNFKHIVKLKTKREINAANTLLGYNIIEIVEPAML